MLDLIGVPYNGSDSSGSIVSAERFCDALHIQNGFIGESIGKRPVEVRIVSAFFLIGGLYLGQVGVPDYVLRSCLIAGLVMLITGVAFYRVLKSE